MKICSVTGHRDIPENKIEHVKKELEKEIIRAVNDGYTHFISGFARSVDLYFAMLVIKHKQSNPNITLEAAIPYRKRLKTNDKDFIYAISYCDKTTVNTEEYSRSCYMIRNEYIVNQSERVIAVFDGRCGGGTDFTVSYAKERKRDLRIIPI